MDVDQQSSSPALSSAPPTPENPQFTPPPLLGPPPNASHHPHEAFGMNSQFQNNHDVATAKTSATSTSNTAASALTTVTAPAKRTRKKREAAAPADEKEKSKEKKPRKPRATKQSVAKELSRTQQPAATAAAPPATIPSWTERKPRPPLMFPQMPRSPSPVHDPVIMHQSPPNPHPSASSMPSPPMQSRGEPHQNVYTNPNLSHIAAPSTPRPASRGQIFDPIRGAARENTASQNAPVSPSHPHVNRASASPSITSLIDPPVAPAPHASRIGSTSAPSVPVSPHASISRPAPIQSNGSTINQPLVPPPPTALLGTVPPPSNFPTEMEVDQPSSRPATTAPPSKSATPSNAPTPPTKPARAKEAPPPLPGSGLLPSIGGPSSTNGTSTNGKFGANIWLTFPLKGRTNVTINYAREVEQKYGFAALHPRLAARNERKRLIAAAGADLEREINAKKPKGSGDDMSVDLSDEEAVSVDEAENEMSGLEGQAAKKSKGSEPHPMIKEMGLDPELYYVGKDGRLIRRRKRKTEDYDRNDDFIDDTEMAWQEQALMAKDGFFVYSGPLVVEGDKQVERADGSTSKPPSTRGRGRGRRSATHTHGVTHADLAAAHAQIAPAPGAARSGSVPAHSLPINAPPANPHGTVALRADGLPTSGPGSRGGRGSRARGGTTVRKPRVTKAERARMDEEKRERERVGAGLRGGHHGVGNHGGVGLGQGEMGGGGAGKTAVPVLGVPTGLTMQAAYPGPGH
ncbi:hypothetical protein P152DRAFT_470058 [Eremomyces bilateralis CBS 781.70]|uniref:Hpc2-related domain-containing protein n=1 Tax=Eremomyces bilateralis CBS 781.70 TaxID=1392243 RepID=A0A6G1GIG9_9PEZI|nr:uncharacterized protein P152DRAFT_470058 [Eremomyces bilateralis CBS 781.70]KAF1817660.1 hypothetical protein P152DRAFT_470058 [Eremomyces bilateralis CBS 781.70]